MHCCGRCVKNTMAELKRRFPSDLDYSIVARTTLPVTEVSAPPPPGGEIVVTCIRGDDTGLRLLFSCFLQNGEQLSSHDARAGNRDRHFRCLPCSLFTNTRSLFAFVLASVLVVDDAIVVVESGENNILKRGCPPRDATLKANEEVSGPVFIAIAVILSAIFLPIALLAAFRVGHKTKASSL